jgi:hypothetical protein
VRIAYARPEQPRGETASIFMAERGSVKLRFYELGIAFEIVAAAKT